MIKVNGKDLTVEEAVPMLINDHFEKRVIELRRNPYIKKASIIDLSYEMSIDENSLQRIEDIDKILDGLVNNEKIKRVSKYGQNYIIPTQKKLDELFVKICFGNFVLENVSCDTVSRDRFIANIKKYKYFTERNFGAEELNGLYLTYLDIKCQKTRILTK